jgi:hypothetical protein
MITIIQCPCRAVEIRISVRGADGQDFVKTLEPGGT